MRVTDLVQRLRGMVPEVPGTRLSVAQAARLAGIEPTVCRQLLDSPLNPRPRRSRLYDEHDDRTATALNRPRVDWKAARGFRAFLNRSNLGRFADSADFQLVTQAVHDRAESMTRGR
jgi:hypothetical protein